MSENAKPTKLLMGDEIVVSRDKLREMGFAVHDDEPKLQGTMSVKGTSATVNILLDDEPPAEMWAVRLASGVWVQAWPDRAKSAGAIRYIREDLKK